MFQCGLLGSVKMSALEMSGYNNILGGHLKCSYILINLEPSSLTRVLFPTISAGYTKSDKIPSWTAVSVRLFGNHCDIM